MHWDASSTQKPCCGSFITSCILGFRSTGFSSRWPQLVFSHDGRRLSFSAASQPPALLVSNGTVRRLESRNGILGCLAETSPSEPSIEVELSPGDRLILYTDGLVEVFNGLDDMLGVEGLETLVLQSATLTLADMQETILAGVAAWGHGPLADDVSLVIVEVR
jgi:serine phosphatase RsbU (regulator of sigma subunit)